MGERSSPSLRRVGARRTSALNLPNGNCGGWMQMLCAMKAWLEHGVNLREGMFK